MKKFEYQKGSTFEDFLKFKEVEGFDSLDVEKQAELFNEFNNVVREKMTELIDGKASKEDIKELNDKLSELIEKQMVELNKKLHTQGIAIRKFIDNDNSNTKHVTLKEAFAQNLKANMDKLQKLKNGAKGEAQQNEFEFEVKAAGTITSANISGGNVPVEDRLEGLNTVPSRRVRLLDVMSQRGTSSTVVSWVYQANKDGSAGQTAEGAAKNQVDFDLVVASQSIKKTTAYIKVSTEMLDDIEWMASEINNELMRELLKAVESQVYSGDDAGQNLNGVRTTATPFAAGTFAGAVDNANIVNVLDVALNQIKIAEHPMDMPVVFMHPSDVTALKLAKVSATDNRTLQRLYQVGSTLLLDGNIPIVETTLVTVDEYLVGDFSKAILVQKEGIRIDIGLDADDFTKNLRTVLAEWRGLVIVKNNDRTAFVKGDFTTDKAALETA